LPISSGATDSIGNRERRFASNADCSEARKPVTTISWRSFEFSEVAVGDCGSGSAMTAVPASMASSDTAVIIAMRAAWRARFSLL
jgi:hypothetical protein